MKKTLLRAAVMLAALSAASCAYRAPAPPPDAGPVNTLCRDRTIRTRPFAHSTVSLRDAESIVHVPEDDNFWIGDDNSQAAFEFDRRTGQYRSRVTAREIIETFPAAGQCDNGARDRRTVCSYTEELELVTYDPATGTLFLFNTVSNPRLDPPVDKPALYQLRKRHGRGRFRLVGWRELPAGRRYDSAVVIEGRLYLSVRRDVFEYDLERNRMLDTDDQGNPIPPVVSSTQGRIVGMAFEGSSLWLLTSRKKLVQVDWSSKMPLDSHDLDPFGISKAKGLAFGAGEFFVVDGDHPDHIQVLRFGRQAKMAWWRGGGQSLSCG